MTVKSAGLFHLFDRFSAEQPAHLPLESNLIDTYVQDRVERTIKGLKIKGLLSLKK